MPRKLSKEPTIASYVAFCTRSGPDHEAAAEAGIARSTRYRLVKRVAARLAPQLTAEVSQRRADVRYALMGVFQRAAAGGGMDSPTKFDVEDLATQMEIGE